MSGGVAPWKIFLTAHFKYLGNAFLDIKIRPFIDRKEQLHLLFQSYLLVHRFYGRFERSSNNNFFIIGAAPLLSTPPATYITHFMKMDIFREGIMNIFNIITRNYIYI